MIKALLMLSLLIVPLYVSDAEDEMSDETPLADPFAPPTSLVTPSGVVPFPESPPASRLMSAPRNVPPLRMNAATRRLPFVLNVTAAPVLPLEAQVIDLYACVRDLSTAIEDLQKQMAELQGKK